MRTSLLVTVVALAGIVAGFIASRLTHDEATQEAPSLYVVDVVLMDSQTGRPVNVKLHYPNRFDMIIGTGFRRCLTELDLETGRRRITWIGTSGRTYHFRFTAEGYQAVDLQPKHVYELNAEEIRFFDPVIIEMTRTERTSQNDGTETRERYTE